MAINAGFYQEPFDYPGLAHFLEHMVFMGSTKYPNENHFDNFISSRNGRTNAFTDAEMTMYFVEIKPDSFDELIDIWSRFFIDPLLNTDSINREIQAVDSEFKLARSRDDFRIQGMFVELAEKAHPASKFGMGNIFSLKKTNSSLVEAPLSLYTRLQDFHNQFYVAGNMNLVLQSSDSLESLEKLAIEKFAVIPSRIAENVKNGENVDNIQNIKNTDPMADITKFIGQIDTWSEMYGKVYEVIPTGNSNILLVIFQLPPTRKNWETDSVGYLSWLIGHESDGSILHQLQIEGLAISLTSSTGKNDGEANNNLFSTLKIQVVLSDTGAERYDTVLDVIFSYSALKIPRKNSNKNKFYSQEIIVIVFFILFLFSTHFISNFYVPSAPNSTFTKK